MSVNYFVDSNLLVYSRDASEPEKQPIARERLTRLWQTRRGRLSVQVLNEFFVTVTRKLDPGLSREEAWADVTGLLTWDPLPVDAQLLKRARAVQERFAFSWWDSLVVAAAQRAARCAYFLSEDLQDGQDLDGVVVLNPFRHPPDQVG